ncbi:hypothetical protein [Candidatus Marithrix sp. Canyon 246]|uniref:hypothetical protein n=1 Tax=Candidatus Marithrix sp. Canyon 246 TaxID=1827136 RepID=UPI00084A228F|nr:hypothetical protein [Candidatus Marithrix sp. Canyon 246]
MFYDYNHKQGFIIDDELYRVNKFPYNLPSLKVTSPFGGDNLIAILCRQPAYGLHRLLKSNKIPTIKQVMARLEGNTCQIGQYGFFTQEQVNAQILMNK